MKKKSQGFYGVICVIKALLHRHLELNQTIYTGKDE